MKKLICMLLVLTLCMSMTAVAGAAGKNSMDLFNAIMQTSGGKTDSAAETAQGSSADFGVPVNIDDPFYEKVRSSSFVRKEYSMEADVFIELKNVSGKTLYPDDATLRMYDVDGNLIEEETYCYVYPSVVEDGATFFVWEWFYNFEATVDQVAYFEVEVETDTSSYYDYHTTTASAYVDDGVMSTEVTNTTDTNIHSIDAVITVENDEGVLMDVGHVSVGNAIAITPGSTMVLMTSAEDYMNDGYLDSGNAAAYVTYQID